MRLECAVEIDAELGEGPIWSVADQCLYWMDMYRPAIYRYRPQDGQNDQLPLTGTGQIGCLVPRQAGGFVLGLPDGLVFYDAESGSVDPFCHPHGGVDGVYYNDAKADRLGRLWLDTYHVSETEPLGCLYKVDPDGRVSTAVDGLAVANGPAIAPDGATLYLADSATRVIYAYSMDMEAGTLGSRSVFAEVSSDAGAPDGMTVDTEGGLWSAHYGGSRITRYRPDGAVDLSVTLPVPQVTSCMFGGPDLTSLYVTTAASGLSEAELAAAPLSGSLFVIETGFTGLPEPEFAG